MSKTDIKRFTVNLDNQGEALTATVSGPGAAEWAKFQQSIAGSHWEADSDGFAYAMPEDHPGILAEIEAEGYVVNDDAYAPED